jgi:SAM-dependent methyltransferase
MNRRGRSIAGEPVDPKRIVSDGYDRIVPAFLAWNSERPPEVRRWFLGEVLARLGEGSSVLELGCGPGTEAGELSDGRRYVGVDLSRGQLAIARERAPSATFVLGDFTSMAFRPDSFDGVAAFYVFMHVPQEDLASTFARVFEWLRPGGRLMLSLSTIEAEDRIEEWLDVPMYFARFTPQLNERLLRETGFHLEMSEVREEGVDDGYGPVEFHWVIARKPVSALLAERGSRSLPRTDRQTSRSDGARNEGLPHVSAVDAGTPDRGVGVVRSSRYGQRRSRPERRHRSTATFIPPQDRCLLESWRQGCL